MTISLVHGWATVGAGTGVGLGFGVGVGVGDGFGVVGVGVGVGDGALGTVPVGKTTRRTGTFSTSASAR